LEKEEEEEEEGSLKALVVEEVECDAASGNSRAGAPLHGAAQEQESKRVEVWAAVATCDLYPKVTERSVKKSFWSKNNARVAGIARRKRLVKAAMTRTKNARANVFASRRALAPPSGTDESIVASHVDQARGSERGSSQGFTIGLYVPTWMRPKITSPGV